MVDLNVRIAEIVQRLAAKSGDAGSIDAETWNAYVGDKGGKTIKSHIDTKNAAAALMRYFQQCSSADNNANDLMEKWFDQTVTDEIGKKYLDYTRSRNRHGEMFDVIGDDGRADPETARMKYLEFAASCIKAIDKEYGNGDGTLTVDEYKKYLDDMTKFSLHKYRHDISSQGDSEEKHVDADNDKIIDKYEFMAAELVSHDVQNNKMYKDRYNYKGKLGAFNTSWDILVSSQTKTVDFNEYDRQFQERIDELKQDTE